LLVLGVLVSQVRVFGHTCDAFSPLVSSGVAGQEKNEDLQRSVVYVLQRKGELSV
jgi:hypothetical protein